MDHDLTHIAQLARHGAARGRGAGDGPAAACHWTMASSWLLHYVSHYCAFNTLLNTLPLVCHQFLALCGDVNVWRAL